MSENNNSPSLKAETVRGFRSSWKTLVLTDIVFKILAFIVLTPLVGVLFRTLIALSGSAVVSDMDIVFFFLGPVGWVCAITVGGLWLGIVALEQAALMGILCAKSVNRELRTLGALRFAASHAWPVLQVTMRIIVFTFFAVSPLLALAAVVYLSLLTEYDINYYIKERPPIFQVAVGIGAIIAAVIAGIILRLASSWFFALPLVLFERTSPRAALQLSSTRAKEHRLTLLGWILAWAVSMVLLSSAATTAIAMIGRFLTPDPPDSLHLLAVTIGITMLLWFVVNLGVNLLGTTTFAAILFSLFRNLGRKEAPDSLLADFAKEASTAATFQLTSNWLLAAGVLGILIATATGAITISSIRLEDNVKIMAHRGASHEAPENTMASFRKAIEDGADWIELDVQETADGEVVIMHDSDFMKQAGRNLKIWNANMDDLQEIDIGSWFAPNFKDQRVPTLAQVLQECKGKIRVNIELKYYGHDEHLEQRVAEIVDAQDMASDVMAMSLKIDGVRKMKSIRPDWQVGLLMSLSAGNIDKVEADFLAINAGFANPNLIRSAHKNGKEVYVWTVNDAASMSNMISRGADGLLTDKPALARSVLEQRAQMSTPERLLLELAGLLGTTQQVEEQ